MSYARPTRTSSLRWRGGNRNNQEHGFAVDPCKSAGHVYNNSLQAPSLSSPHPQNIPTNIKIDDQSFNGRAKTLKDPTCSEDLYATGSTIDYKTAIHTFCFPTPSPRPCSPSPRFPPGTTGPSPFLSPHKGMAMGSPSHAPPNWGRATTSDCVPSATHQPAPTRPSMEPRTRTERVTNSGGKAKKGSGWRSFGNLFRKPASQESSCVDEMTRVEEFLRTEKAPPRAQPMQLSCMAMPTQNISRTMQSPATSRSRAYSQNDSRSGHRATAALPATQGKLRKPPRQRRPSHAERSQTERAQTERSQIERRSPKKEFEEAIRSRQYISPMKGSEEAIETRQNDRHDSPFDTHRAAVDEPKPTALAPKLECDIPRPEMDRYSVMFSQLLDSQAKPSLLERRQSRMSRYMPVGELTDESNPPRNSTTPRPMPQPMSITIKRRDRASTSTPAARRPQEILLPRCYTAPPPLRPAPATQKSAAAAAPVSLTNSPSSALYSENSLLPTPTTATTCATTLDFPALVSRDENTWLSPAKTLPTVHSASQNTVPTFNSTSSIAVSTPLSIGRTSPTDTDMTTSRPNYPRIKSPADLERQIVQVSVARQVSVSRARTRVQQALPSKQPLRPRVVNLSASSGPNRKSEVGLFETADCGNEPMPGQ